MNAARRVDRVAIRHPGEKVPRGVNPSASIASRNVAGSSALGSEAAQYPRAFLNSAVRARSVDGVKKRAARLLRRARSGS